MRYHPLLCCGVSRLSSCGILAERWWMSLATSLLPLGEFHKTLKTLSESAGLRENIIISFIFLPQVFLSFQLCLRFPCLACSDSSAPVFFRVSKCFSFKTYPIEERLEAHSCWPLIVKNPCSNAGPHLILFLTLSQPMNPIRHYNNCIFTSVRLCPSIHVPVPLLCVASLHREWSHCMVQAGS